MATIIMIMERHTDEAETKPSTAGTVNQGTCTHTRNDHRCEKYEHIVMGECVFGLPHISWLYQGESKGNIPRNDQLSNCTDK